MQEFYKEAPGDCPIIQSIEVEQYLSYVYSSYVCHFSLGLSA